MQKLADNIGRLARNRFGLTALIAAVSASVVYVLRLQADTVVGGWFERSVWTPLASLWGNLASQPTGEAMLAVLVAVTLLVTAAVLDESKTVTALRAWWDGRRPAPPKLEWEERQQIQEFRAFWNGTGRIAANTLHALWEHTYRHVDRSKYYKRYLELPVSAFQDAGRQMDELLADDSIAPLSNIQAATEVFYQQYQRLVGFTLEIFENEHAQYSSVDGFYRDFTNRGEAWRSIHADFRNGLERLAHRPENRGLKVFPGPELREEVKSVLRGEPFPTTRPLPPSDGRMIHPV
jgi:hypothetical protein